jgi:hypothetical protein
VNLAILTGKPPGAKIQRECVEANSHVGFLAKQCTFPHRVYRVYLSGSSIAARLKCTYVEIAVGRDAPHRGRAGFAGLARVGSDNAWRLEAAANRVGDRRASRN